MATATLVDAFEVEFDLLVTDVTDHWESCGVFIGPRARTDAVHTVRVALAAIHAHGMHIVPTTTASDPVRTEQMLVPMARYLTDNPTGTVRGSEASRFGRARQDAAIILASLACQDRALIPA